MDKNKLLPYFEMPKASLLALLELDFDNLLIIEKETRANWIKEKKCPCVHDADVLNGRLLLACEHVKNEIKEKTKEIEKKMNFKSDILILRNLRDFKSIQNCSNRI